MKVLFIGGAGRSGSTLLETVLGQIDGIIPVGEFNEIWKSGIVENGLCGCGRNFLKCDFWANVLDEAFGGLQNIDVKKMVEAQDQACRVRHIPRMILPLLQSQNFNEKTQTIRAANRALLESLKKVTNAKVIVDSTKTAAQAYMLSSLDNVDLHILHLVRDSRAVAYSWHRRKTIPDPARGNPEMVRKTSVQSAIDWNLGHAFLETLKISGSRRFQSYQVLKYEDFVQNPREVISSLVGRLGVNADTAALFSSSHVLSRDRVTHTLEGNPSKFKTGNIEIRADEEWRELMRPSERRLVSALTAIHQRKFGYR